MDNLKPEYSIIIPAYNERMRLPAFLLETTRFLDMSNKNYEIIVVNDGSTDNTAELVETFSSLHPKVRLVDCKKNKGKGHAVRKGMLEGKGEFLLFCDADGSTSIQEIERLKNAMGQSSDFAIASRAIPSKDVHVDALLHRKLLGRMFSRAINWLVVPDVRDTQCGFKLFRRRAARFLFSNQKTDRWGFDVELLFLAQKVGISFVEIPVNWKNVPGSKVNLIRDSIRMFWDAWRLRWRHRKLKSLDWEQFEAI